MENKNTIELNVVRLGGNHNGKVPTKLSELENDMNFATKDQVGGGWRFVKDLIVFDGTLSSYELELHSLIEGNYERILIECDNNGYYNGGTPVYFDNIYYEPIGYDSIECEKKRINGAWHWFVTNLGQSITAKNMNEEDVEIAHCSSKKAVIGLLGFKSVNSQRNLDGTIKLYVKQ